MKNFRGKCCSIIFQDPMTSLNPVFTIGNQLMEAILLHTDKNKQQAKERAIEMLELVGVNEPQKRIKQYPHELSGGMRQRSVLAIALASDPDILIADEPTANLDPDSAWDLMQLLEELNYRGMTILVASHARGLVTIMKRRCITLIAGRMAADEKRSIYNQKSMDIFAERRILKN